MIVLFTMLCDSFLPKSSCKLNFAMIFPSKIQARDMPLFYNLFQRNSLVYLSIFLSNDHEHYYVSRSFNFFFKQDKKERNAPQTNGFECRIVIEIVSCESKGILCMFHKFFFN